MTSPRTARLGRARVNVTRRGVARWLCWLHIHVGGSVFWGGTCDNCGKRVV